MAAAEGLGKKGLGIWLVVIPDGQGEGMSREPMLQVPKSVL